MEAHPFCVDGSHLVWIGKKQPRFFAQRGKSIVIWCQQSTSMPCHAAAAAAEQQKYNMHLAI
jgi:hypothetical protein